MTISASSAQKTVDNGIGAVDSAVVVLNCSDDMMEVDDSDGNHAGPIGPSDQHSNL